jgi:hypothetical protein
MSWFYHYVKDAMATKYDLFLQGSYTRPDAFYCFGGCDAIAVSKDGRSEYYICEIKSIDESPKSWLKHPDKEDKNNPEQFDVRDYWIKQSENNSNTSIQSEVFAWAFVITGQLEQYFMRGCALKYKTHKNMSPQANTLKQPPTLACDKKRCLIFDGYFKNVVNKSIEILNLTNPEIEEYQDGTFDWLKVYVLKFERPITSNHKWFNEKR